MINTGRRLYEFGPFRVDPSHRVLLRDNKPVPLHPKAFDILLVLVERSETVVPKDHLMKAVWPETFVEESNLAQNIFVLRKTLGDAVGENRFIVTVPGRGYRFAEKVQVVDEGEVVAAEQDQLIVESHTRSRLVVEQRAVPSKSLPGKRPGLRLGIGLAIVLAGLVGAGVYFYLPRGPKLPEKDTIVLGDFDNKTGDQGFDGTLRQGRSAQLEQSPFLNLLSDSRIAQTLSLMTQPKDSRLSPELAREVCQRTASAAELNGAIAQIGARYLLTLNAVNCSTGESLGSAEAEASNKDHVLDALGKLATQIRRNLGESLAWVKKYAVPPADVTTSSLDALHTYSLAMKAVSMNFLTPIRIMQHAIEQDPNFAMAYARLGVMYVNIAETQQGAEAISKAYTLRDRVSEREKLYISTRYDQMVTGDLLAARKDFELFEQIYPRDPVALANLGVICLHLGDFDKLFSFTQASIKLSPRSDIHGSNDIWTYIFLNRFDEAKAMAVSGLKTLPDEPSYHSTLYTIAFVERDFAGMQREAQAYITNPTWGDSALNNEANSAGYFGQLAKAREFTKQAADAARKQEKKETPATYDAEAAIREALAGNIAVAKQNVKTALALSRSKDVEAMSALALALAGDSREATQLATELDRQFPKNTILQLNYLPTIRAAEQLWDGGGRIDPAKAIEMLAPVTPYELGITALEEGLSLYPVYVRGQALLLARNGSAAATEFQKIIQHPGVVQNEPIGALAYLGLARAYALSHDSAQAHAAYQEFFALWKDADPDVPILKQARAEYAKLQ